MAGGRAPPRVRVPLHACCPAPNEAAVLHPAPPRGARPAKLADVDILPCVTGDSRGTLRALTVGDQWHARLVETQSLVPAGKNAPPVFTGNHCKGSLFRDGTALITPALTEAAGRDRPRHPDFHFGRFDARFTTRAELRRGTGFTLIEINGAGSEPTHIWDPAVPAWRIWTDQLAHQRIGSARHCARGAECRACRHVGGAAAEAPDGELSGARPRGTGCSFLV